MEIESIDQEQPSIKKNRYVARAGRNQLDYASFVKSHCFRCQFCKPWADKGSKICCTNFSSGFAKMIPKVDPVFHGFGNCPIKPTKIMN